MKDNVQLTVASLLSILFLTFHLADDIVRGYEKGGLSNLDRPFGARIVEAATERLDAEPAAEAASGIVGVGAIVIQEDLVVAAIAVEGATEFSNLRRCFHPARCFQVEVSESLEFPILFFS